ncbi:hypothetical protein JAO76_04830 [Pontibacter sp. BT310]|uniref:DUF4345 domain-containing protein n=1 Tax=Pontibacter populi TaxID=890055 RepID=A0ABS6XAZ8_9BACT|nr:MULTISPECIES: hypothetical protein [Pontibacter]MBJ6117502.1 hypothetical protein [Pontibacter sp. BT310]MBR0569927.1 hypothetical protein [Microvirga sp. STS03]MBW3364355.1 hypothetical protein [Pontibacter populi]
MELHFKVIGAILIVLALVHIIFPRYFNWVEELKPLSLINRQMMTTHTFFIALTVFLMGLLCLTSANELIVTDLGKKISLGFAVFWMIRLYFQFFGYSAELWEGKRFETIVHVLFSCLWSYLSVAFLTAYFN